MFFREAVDRLVVVSDHADVAAIPDQQAEQLPLRKVRVLVLVDKYVVKPLGQAAQYRRVFLENTSCGQNQLAEVDCARLGQEAVVFLVEARELELSLALTVSVTVGRGGGRRLSEREVLLGGDHLVLEPVDALDQLRHQRGGIPPDRMVL